MSCSRCAGPSAGMPQLIEEIRAKVGDAEVYEALERIVYVQSNNFSNLTEVSSSYHEAT